MTAAVEAAPDLQPHLDVPLAGWGRTARTVGTVTRPACVDDVARALAGARHVVARGMGRSYGDAAQCSGGLTVDVTGLSHIGEVDDATGTIEVDGGASLHELMKRIVPAGWFVGVTPGRATSRSAAPSRRTCTGRTTTGTGASPGTWST